MPYVPLNEVKGQIMMRVAMDSRRGLARGAPIMPAGYWERLVDGDINEMIDGLYAHAIPFTCNEKMHRFSAELFRGSKI